MTAKALGIIEAIGLAAAIEAADAAAKAATVTVLGYENARGGGRITVKLVGDVGAVRAAVSAGSAAGRRVGAIAGCLVIPRPHAEIEALIARVDRGRRPGPPPVAATGPEPVAVTEPLPAPEAPAAVAAEPSAPGRPVAVAELLPAPEAPAAAAPEIALAEPTATASPEAEPHRPLVKRGKARKGELPAAQDPGEVEG
jgi:hypothetical protein